MTIVQTPTPNLEQSIDFYKKLAFTDISQNGQTLFTDGSVVLHINEERTARAGLKLFSSNCDALVEKLKPFGKAHKTDDGYIVAEPGGSWLYLMNGTSGINIPEGIKASNVGHFMGMSAEVIDMEFAQAFWEALGFSVTMGTAEQGWIALQNADEIGVSIMKPMACPHLFFNPSLTFFNGGKNLELIPKIREAKVPIAEEITLFNKEGIVDNLILQDPGGLGMFMFND